MEPIVPRRRWLDDTRIAIRSALDAAEFIYEHRVWEGFLGYRWVVKGLVWMTLILLLVGLYNAYDSLQSAASLSSQLSSLHLFSLQSLSGLTSGWGNYVTLIAIEIIIFHFARRTMMIVTEEEIDTSWQTFLGAEMRMIRLAIFAFIMEILMKAVASVGVGISNIQILEDPVNMLIHSFYLGFAVIDNFNELYGMNMQQSHRYSFHYLPVTLVVGGILAVLLNIPLAGVIIGPVLCSVIGTLAMYSIQQRDGSVAWIFNEKESTSHE